MTGTEIVDRETGELNSSRRRSRRNAIRTVLSVRRSPRKRGRVAVALAGSWVGLVVIVALVVQWLPLHDPGQVAGSPNLGPNWSAEFLGTDTIGRSELSRLAYGARASLGISVVACAIALAVGALLGLVTAYYGSWLTTIVDIVTNAVLAVPALLLLLAIVLALNPTLVTLTLALSLIFVPAFMRLARAKAKGELSRDYIVAARIMGANKSRLMFKEVLPNSVTPLISYAALVIPSLMVTEGSLSFLGHGVQPPTPSWGAMIAQAQPYLAQYPAPAIVPCVVLFLTVYALNVLGDALRVKLDVREMQL
jgi:peptide/nickel transport system permease protein